MLRSGGYGVIVGRNVFSNTIKTTSYFNKLTHASAFILFLLILFTFCPICLVSEDTNAATKNANPSTLTFSFIDNKDTASVSLTVTDENGNFATSTESQKAAFSLSTNNATGYTLNLRTTGATTTLSDGTHSINTISSSGITADNFAVNTYGILPSKYNSSSNTTNYYPASSTGWKMDETSAANTTANTYTIGLGLKANYATAAGTYTTANTDNGNTGASLVLEYVANPVTYSINYYSNAGSGATVSGMPSINPQTGIVTQGTTSTSVTLASAPTRTGYTFTGWCMGTSSSSNITTTNGVDICSNASTNQFTAGQSFGIDATKSPDTYYLYAMWEGNEYTATIYYNNKTSSGTSGATPSITSDNTAKCRVTTVEGTSCTILDANIPSAVKSSVGQYNNTYAGLATATGTMSSSTDIVLSSNSNFYAVYRTTVTLYKPSSTSARTSVTLYRNQWLTSTSAMATTVLSDSNTGTSNYSYSSSVSGYALYGFSASTNTYTRTYSAISELVPLTTTTFYAIDYDSDGAVATFYYNNNTNTTSCTTAAVKSTTGTAARYLYTTSSAATTTSGESISVPSAVSSSKGTCGMAYKNVGTSTSNMTAASPTAGNTYYASYSGSITNYYYSSGYTNRTIYRNQWVTGTAAANMSTIVLSTSDTGTSNYSTAGGPGTTASSWAGLATSATTTVAYSSVSAAATANTVYSNLYTIYQFNINYSTTGSTGVSSIGTTTGNCKVTTSSTSCTVTLPAINVQSGYESLGWGTQGHTSAGTAAGATYTLSTNSSTLYANAKVSCSSTISGTMQSASSASAYCDGASGTMTDSRDNQTYTVKKINGALWMTRNLAIGCNGSGSTYGSGFSSKSLTSSNSNVSASWSTPTLSLDKNDNTTNCTTSSTIGCNSHTDARMKCSSTYGAWYNYAAATAGTITGDSNSTIDTYNICPKGWTLPSYDASSSAGSIHSVTSYKNDFSPVADGYYRYGAIYDATYGNWWSTSAGNATNRRLLRFNGSSLSASSSTRENGNYLRCIKL